MLEVIWPCAILITGFAFTNRTRGRGKFFERGLFNVLTACFFFALTAQMGLGGEHTWWQAFCGSFVWARFGGWGLYFASFHGRWNYPETEVPIIDWIGFKLVPWVGENDHRSNRARGTLCMALRGLYVVPMFLVLFDFSLPALLLGMAAGLSQGVIYGAMRVVPEEVAVETAEPITGAWFGTALALVSIMR